MLMVVDEFLRFIFFCIFLYFITGLVVRFTVCGMLTSCNIYTPAIPSLPYLKQRENRGEVQLSIRGDDADIK